MFEPETCEGGAGEEPLGQDVGTETVLPSLKFTFDRRYLIDLILHPFPAIQSLLDFYKGKY